MIRVCPKCKSKNSLPTEGNPSKYGRPVCSKCRADLFPPIANSSDQNLSLPDLDNEDDQDNREEYAGITGWIYKQRMNLLFFFAWVGFVETFMFMTKETWLEGKGYHFITVAILVWYVANDNEFTPKKRKKEN